MVEEAEQRALNGIELGVFASRLEAVCDEMGAVLQRSAFSPNIKDRLDFSCAVFDAEGELSAQAAHIPVHLGSMAYAMAGIVNACEWAPGDMVVVNDPYLGGTHLPDVTVIAPVFAGQQLVAFIANRAHHANIGASSPGSMPIASRLEEEGVVIEPTHLLRSGQWQEALLETLSGGGNSGDFIAQVSANQVGVERLLALVESMAVERYGRALQQLNHYAEQIARAEFASIPEGSYAFTDYMDDDGKGAADLPVSARVTVQGGDIQVDFTGTAGQVGGNINCPLSVAAAAVFYVFRCLLPAGVPACAGLFRPIHLTAPGQSLVNASRPAAVAAGNVETSTRITDVILGALAHAVPDRIPAASHGSMNNLAMGCEAVGESPRWDYYETLGGGMGGHPNGEGLGGVQTHMTNTLNTPIESLELHYPLRVTRYQLRSGSGGAGQHGGGNGVLREFEFLAPASATLLTERRRRSPWGLAGGEGGQPGENRLNGEWLPAKCALSLSTGDRLSVASAGGGGWGRRS